MAFPLENPNFAFLRFHVNVGARLAAKILAPLIALFFAALYVFKIDFFIVLAHALFAESHLVVSGLLYSAIMVSTSRIISPRICLGLVGWIRHLPLKSRANRRLALFSIFIAQIPMLLSLSLPSLLLSNSLGINPSVYIFGLPVLGLSSALFVLPIRKGIFIKPFVLAACILSASGSWAMLISGVFIFLICDLISGPLVAGKKRYKFSKITKGLGLGFFIALRAVKWRVSFPYILAFAVLGLTRVFIWNNDFGPILTGKIQLFGGASSAVVFCSFFAQLLSVRRPAWPWSRSFPWSSRRRILMDVSFLAFLTLPLILMVFIVEKNTLLPLLFSLPLLCLLSSWSMRRTFELRTGGYETILIFGLIAATLLCLFPMISIVYFVFSPLLLIMAVKQERFLKVSLWMERHHLAVGDSLSWRQE